MLSSGTTEFKLKEIQVSCLERLGDASELASSVWVRRIVINQNTAKSICVYKTVRIEVWMHQAHFQIPQSPSQPSII